MQYFYLFQYILLTEVVSFLHWSKEKRNNQTNQPKPTATKPQHNKTTRTTNAKKNFADLPYKAVSVLFGKLVHLCVITSVPGEVVNPCAIADVPSITQTSQTSEYNVKECSMFVQKWLVSYEIRYLYLWSKAE